jgi:hypothetical protein
MKKRMASFLGAFLLFCLLTLPACNLPGTAREENVDVDALARTIMAQTLSTGGNPPEETEGDAQLSGEDAAVPTTMATMSPSAALTATMTLTPTLQKPMVSVSMDTNCRTGPGKLYDYLGALLVGETADVVGQSLDGQYWIINNPDLPGECWLWGFYATVEGSVEGLQKFTPPPTPTPMFQWAGDWTIYVGEPGGMLETDPMTITVVDSNLTAVIDLGGGMVVNISGTISEDYLSATGNWTLPGHEGTFTWYALGANQFQGMRVDEMNVFAWCGSRAGAGQPVPCYRE